VSLFTTLVGRLAWGCSEVCATGGHTGWYTRQSIKLSLASLPSVRKWAGSQDYIKLHLTLVTATQLCASLVPAISCQPVHHTRHCNRASYRQSLLQQSLLQQSLLQTLQQSKLFIIQTLQQSLFIIRHCNRACSSLDTATEHLSYH